MFADRSLGAGEESEGTALWFRGMLSGLGDEELARGRGPQLSVMGGGGCKTISCGVSLRFREKRFRRDER